MKLFLHDLTRIRIINDTQEWRGTPAEFQALEPLYPGLPAGMMTRYQTPERSYVTDGDDIYPDSFDALGYCENLGNYPAYTPSGVMDFYVEDTAQRLPFGAGGTLTFPAITGTPNAISIDCATSGHNHDSAYAPVHTHPYAASTHNHTGVYAPVHTHPYAASTHYHTGLYAPSSHVHADLSYSLTWLVSASAVKTINFDLGGGGVKSMTLHQQGVNPLMFTWDKSLGMTGPTGGVYPNCLSASGSNMGSYWACQVVISAAFQSAGYRYTLFAWS